MNRPAERLIMFHGTSDVFLQGILDRGLVPAPDRKLSASMAESGGHTVSMPGAYMTADLKGAGNYANQAVKHFGGGPITVCVSVDIRSLVPDEDEVLFALGWPLSWALGFDEGLEDEEGQVLDSWSIEAARRAVSDLLSNDGHLVARADAEAMAGCLDRMMSTITGPGWDHHPRLFCPDYNSEGWSSPEWVRKLAGTSAGMGVYRREMDLFCRHMAGMDPYRYPCGLESCKGRLVEGVACEGPDDGSFIFAVGTKDAPLLYFDDFRRLSGNEEVHGGNLERVLWHPKQFVPS